MALGKTTQSMIAVPFHNRNATCGVLTAVRIGQDSSFQAGDASCMERQSEVMASLLQA
jgi:hypothetical protein